MRIKIGDLLVKAGVITELQLKAALAEQSQWGGKLGDILVRMEFVTEGSWSARSRSRPASPAPT